MYTSLCKHCKKVFKSKIRTYTCNECRSLDAEHFDEIEAYLKEYPNSNSLQISEALNISAFEVINYIKEGRLNVSKGIFTKLE